MVSLPYQSVSRSTHHHAESILLLFFVYEKKALSSSLYLHPEVKVNGRLPFESGADIGRLTEGKRRGGGGGGGKLTSVSNIYNSSPGRNNCFSPISVWERWMEGGKGGMMMVVVVVVVSL